MELAADMVNSTVAMRQSLHNRSMSSKLRLYRPLLWRLSARIALAIILGSPLPLSGYQPTRWSPMNFYIENDAAKKIKGPRSIQVFDAEGALLASAEYSYSASGRLKGERFSGPKGELQGDTKYSYGAYGITQERSYSDKGKLLSQIKFFYNAQKRLRAMRVYGERGRLQLEQRYRYKDGRLSGGVEERGEQRDYFELRYEENRLIALIIRDERKEQVAKISYRYDRQGRLQERLRLYDREISRCLYHYNEQGKISGYSYYEQRGRRNRRAGSARPSSAKPRGKERASEQEWRKTKELIFSY